MSSGILETPLHINLIWHFTGQQWRNGCREKTMNVLRFQQPSAECQYTISPPRNARFNNYNKSLTFLNAQRNISDTYSEICCSCELKRLLVSWHNGMMDSPSAD
jgi:hypothetical protein